MDEKQYLAVFTAYDMTNFTKNSRLNHYFTAKDDNEAVKIAKEKLKAMKDCTLDRLLEVRDIGFTQD